MMKRLFPLYNPIYIVDLIINAIGLICACIPIAEVQVCAIAIIGVSCIILFVLSLIIREYVLHSNCKLKTSMQANNVHIISLIAKSIISLIQGIVFIVLTTFVKIPEAYIVVFSIFAFLMSLLSIMVVFAHLRLFHVYPLNKLDDYFFDPLQTLTNGCSDSIKLTVTETVKGKWELLYNERSLVFDLENCLCPKTVVLSYLNRQFRYIQINNKKLPIKFLWGKVLFLDYLSKYDCDNVSVCFVDYKRRKYQKTIIQNKISKMNYSESKLIIDTIYSNVISGTRHSGYKIKRNKYKRLNEEIYLNYSDSIRKKHSIR